MEVTVKRSPHKFTAQNETAPRRLTDAATDQSGPPSWVSVRLGDIAKIKTGAKNNDDKVSDGRYPFFVRSQSVERIDTYSFDGEAILVPGEGGIGTILHYVDGKFDYHQRVYRVSNFAPGVHAKFFYYYMSQHFEGHALRGTVKATVDSLRLPTFITFPVLLPSEREQRAIAAVLSDADALIEALDRRIAKKRDIKQAAMAELLTGKTRLPGFAEEWRVYQLQELGSFEKGRGIRRDDLSDEGVGCVTYGELYTRYENYFETPVSRISASVAKSALPIGPGTLLFAGSGETAEDIGKCVAYVGSETIHAGGDTVAFRSQHHDPVFLAHLMNHGSVVRQKTRLGQGHTVVHIHAKHLGALSVLVPPPPEQRAIAAILRGIDAEIGTIEGQRAKLRMVREGMSQALLTGRVRLPLAEAQEASA